MAVNLVQAAQLAFNRGEEKMAEVMLNFAQSSMVLQYLPFQTINGNAISFNREERLPAVGFRGYNEQFQEDSGEVTPITESLALYGGDLDIDREIVRAFGLETRTQQEAMKVRAMALEFDRVFVKGDKQTNPRVFDGLQKRCTGTQLINAGSTSGGDALALSKLDLLKSRVRMPSHWIMSLEMKLKLIAAARDTDVSGYVQFTTDTLGQEITQYAGLPIITMEQDGTGNDILPFTEANPGGGSPASTSIYCISVRSDGLTGIQGSDMEVRDLGELQEKPIYRTRVDWSVGLAIYDGRSIARLQGIKDAAIVS